MKRQRPRPTRFDFSKGAWMAQRSGQKGADALEVLQDALEIAYPTALHTAIRKAERRTRRTGYPTAVLFGPTMERAIRKYRAEGTQRFYSAQHWPFFVSSNPHNSRPTAVVIWDTDHGRNVHYWAENRRPVP